MRMLGFARRTCRETRGSVLVIVTAGVVAVLAAAALAVDVGMMMSARSESQRTADLAALAGAGGLVQTGDPQVAEDFAIDYASRNLIRKQAAQVLPVDVVVDVPNAQVTVTVNRTTATGNPIGTFFAKVFGVHTVDIRTDATADAVVSSGPLKCLLPIAVPDKFIELGGDPDKYDDGIDNYVPWDPDDPDAFYTGYSTADIGKVITLRPFGGGPGEVNPSWYYAWRPDGQHGGADYRLNIWDCVDPTLTYEIGDFVDTEPGNMIGPTRQGFDKLYDLDDDAIWNTSAATPGCVTTNGSDVCRGSPRIRPLPFFDPRDPPGNGMKPFPLTNFAGVFVLDIQGSEITGVFLGFSGVAPGGTESASGGGSGPAFRRVRLIE